MVEHPEWHDPQFRENLRLLDGPGLAQELLRHIPVYVTGYRHIRQRLDTLTDLRARYELVGSFARHWGYPVPADPDVPAWIQPALWSPEAYPGVTILVEAPEGFHVRTIPARFLHGLSPAEQSPGILVVVVSPDDGGHHLQIRGRAASARPAALIPLDGAEEIRIAQLRRFLKRLTGTSVPGLPRSLSLPPYHVWRMADVICAYAGRMAGASQREIGRVLDPSVRTMNARQWDTSSQRARVGRLLKRAARLADRREYVSLLRPDRFRLRA